MTAAADNSAPAEANDKTNTLFAGSTGTAEDPWQISTAEQLYRIHDDLTAQYVLIADIDLSAYENWTPIGAFQSLFNAPEDAEVPHPDYAFTGTFNGDSLKTVPSNNPPLNLIIFHS